ncbi:MAG: transcription termination/antitermination protein NusG [Candidatus Parcubacteria bacterium]|nr:MAG: transcription termination/antitermination protein NusG [Candidatus Parcubacteria bacterium]
MEENEKMSARTTSKTNAQEAQGDWYAVHTYSGYEQAAVRNLMQRVESLNVGHLIFEAVIPTETRVRMKGGKRVEERERIYPGYILVRMILTEESQFIVRTTPRISGFVGGARGGVPTPLSQKEVDALFARIQSQTAKHHIDLHPGDTVQIIDGPFKDQEGRVGEVDEERGMVRVLVPMFGRDTPVELDYAQVRRIS